MQSGGSRAGGSGQEPGQGPLGSEGSFSFLPAGRGAVSWAGAFGETQFLGAEPDQREEAARTFLGIHYITSEGKL